MGKTIRIAIHAGLVLVFIGSGLLGFHVLKESREALGRQEPQTPLPLVRTVPIEMGVIDMSLSGEGTVQAVKQSQVVPQVSGRVIHVSEHLVNGGSFEKGELLLKIEPRDYEIAVTLAEASVKDAESSYEMAQQESHASRREWKRIHPGEAPPPLVAKEPQLTAARAHLEAQQANLAKARLNLARTQIRAPFDGRVRDEQVDVGQYVSPGQALATVYGTDAAEIVVPMENQDLNWFAVPGFTTDQNPGAKAVVRAQVAGQERTWTGHVLRVEGSINEKTRMVNVVILVPEPYATRPPLSIGQFAEVAIEGKTLYKAALIPRAALREGSRVWAVDPDKGRLYFRDVEVARKDERGVVVQSGLKATDQVVVSPLKAVTDGMAVRFVNSGHGDLS
ncbi:MAG: efflux RND transporter periplasmic adaptor subunit [Thermodesulfobacteriota bacterium]